MSELIVIGYDDEFKAEEVRLALLRLQQDYLVGPPGSSLVKIRRHDLWFVPCS